MTTLTHLFLSVGIVISTLSSAGHCNPLLGQVFSASATKENTPHVVYRGDYRDPTTIKNEGGFKTRGAPTSDTGFSLIQHVEHFDDTNTCYVSATERLNVAVDIVTDDTEGYVYEIHLTPNAIDINKSYKAIGQKNKNFEREREHSFLGGISWQQVKGWRYVETKEFDLKGIKYPAVHQPVVNPDYNPQYEQFEGAGAQPQLLQRAKDSVTPLRDEASQLMSNEENKKAQAIGGGHYAPSFCAKGQAACSPKFGVANDALYRSKWGLNVVQKAPQTGVVFYGDFRWPEEARKQGGFLTPADIKYRGSVPTSNTYSLLEHMKEQQPREATFFLPTFDTFGMAAEVAAKSAAVSTKGFAGVVYAISATPNIIDVDLTMGNREGALYPTEHRFAAAGGIQWSQVLGWIQVPTDYAQPVMKNIKTKEGLRESFEAAFKQKRDLFKPNPDYDAKFDTLSANTHAQPQLVQSSNPNQELLQFMKENGEALGWTGKFPLFEPHSLIRGKESAEAKTKGQVSQPLEPGVLEKTWSFIKDHSVATAMLPAVVAAQLIPGLGEAADVAELAALTADAADVVGLTAEAAEAVGESEALVEAEMQAIEADATAAGEQSAEAGIQADGGGEIAKEGTKETTHLTPQQVDEALARIPELPPLGKILSLDEKIAQLPSVPRSGLSRLPGNRKGGRIAEPFIKVGAQ